MLSFLSQQTYIGLITQQCSNWGTDISSGTAFTAVDAPIVDALTGGTDDYSLTNGEISIAYNKFADAENVDVNLIIGGSSSIATDTQANYDTHVIQC